MVHRNEYSTVVELETDPRDNGCCSVNFVKYLFVIFNVLFLVRYRRTFPHASLIWPSGIPLLR